MTSRTPLWTSLVAAAALALAGCRSGKGNSAPVDAPFPCTCGTPEAAVESCLHPLCVAGETNPDNPECACGTLTFGKE